MKEFDAPSPNGHDYEVLDEIVDHRQGPFEVVKQYVRGWYPGRGQMIENGYQGRETIIDQVHLKPIKTFRVSENGHHSHEDD